MWNDLYFIPLIARALRHPNPKMPLEEAFRRIREIGQQAQYQVGYEQFLQFMEEVAAAEGSTAASASGLIRSVFGQFPAAEEDGPRGTVSLHLKCNGQKIADLDFPPEGGTGSVDDISPGLYTLLLDTGCVIWENVLTESDLLWAEAFPGQPLELAADTGETDNRPTIRETLLGGEIVLRVFAGTETGRIQIETKPSNFPGR